MSDNYWHLKKEVNVGHFLTTIILAVGLITWGMGIDSRLSRAEVRIEAMMQLMAENRVDQKNMRDELMQELRYIRTRLDVIHTRSVETKVPQ
jgi:hypothetical protein